MPIYIGNFFEVSHHLMLLEIFASHSMKNKTNYINNLPYSQAEKILISTPDSTYQVFLAISKRAPRPLARSFS